MIIRKLKELKAVYVAVASGRMSPASAQLYTTAARLLPRWIAARSFDDNDLILKKARAEWVGAFIPDVWSAEILRHFTNECGQAMADNLDKQIMAGIDDA